MGVEGLPLHAAVGGQGGPVQLPPAAEEVLELGDGPAGLHQHLVGLYVQALLQALVARRDDEQPLLPLAQGRPQGSRRRAEGGHPGDDPGLIALFLHQPVDVHVGGVHRGVSQGQHGHGFSPLQQGADVLRRPGVGGFGRRPVPVHGRGAVQDGLARDIVLNDVQGRPAGAGVGGGDHVRLPNDPDGLYRQQLRVPGAHPHAV